MKSREEHQVMKDELSACREAPKKSAGSINMPVLLKITAQLAEKRVLDVGDFPRIKARGSGFKGRAPPITRA